MKYKDQLKTHQIADDSIMTFCKLTAQQRQALNLLDSE